MVYRHRFFPDLFRINEAPSVIYIITQDHEVGREEGPILRRCGVGEFEAIRAIVHGDVKRERLIKVAEVRIGGRERSMRRGDTLTKTPMSQ